MNVSSTWAKMASCYENMGDIESAIELLNECIFFFREVYVFYLNRNTIIAVTDDPSNVDFKLHLAELYDAVGDEDKAKELIEDGNIIPNIFKSISRTHFFY